MIEKDKIKILDQDLFIGFLNMVIGDLDTKKKT